MSRGINKVMLMGNVGHDPEMIHTNTGQLIAKISLATSSEYKENGQMKDKTEWHRIVLFGKPAEIAGQYVKKGSKIFIEGTIKYKKWVDKNGLEKNFTEIVAAHLQMIDTKPKSDITINGNVAESEDNYEEGIPF